MDISDHLPIFLLTSVNGILDTDSNPSTYRIIKPSTINKFKELTEHLSRDHVLANPDPQKAYTLFINEISTMYNVAFPVKRKSFKFYSKPVQPWHYKIPQKETQNVQNLSLEPYLISS